MTDPRILDSTGAVLAVGDRVRHEDGSEPGEFCGLQRHPDGEMAALIRWAGCDLPGWETASFELPNTYRCNDLTRITTEERDR